MSSDRGCEEIRELIPELALGVAEGDERARALEHLADCQPCRLRLRELSSIADELLLLAPSEEPPAGFETRVLENFQPRPSPRRRLAPLRMLVPVAAAGLAVALTMVFAYRGDRELASHYRSTLDEVNGKYLAGERLRGPGGTYEGGKVYGYEGEPSWVLVTLNDADTNSTDSMSTGTYDLQLVTRDGRRISLRPLRVEHGVGSSGQAIPIPFHDVAEVRLLGSGRGDVYDARFEGD